MVSGRDRGCKRREALGGVAIHRSWLPGYNPISWHHFERFASRHIRRRQRDYDLLHVHGIFETARPTRQAILQGLPVVIKVSRAGPANDLLRLRSLDPDLGRCMLERAWFIAQTSLVGEEIRDCGVAGERIFSIPNGIDVDRFRPDVSAEERGRMRSELGVTNACAVYVGRLDPVKRLDLVIRALPLLSDVSLLVVGDGTERRPLEELAQDTGVGPRVRFVGKVKDVRPYLGAADIFVLPTSSEGFSNSMLEAMAMGLPCVVSPILAVDELIGRGEPAALIAQDEVEDWSRALSLLVKDPGLREAVARAGLEGVRSRFTLDATADKIAAAYEVILGRA